MLHLIPVTRAACTTSLVQEKYSTCNLWKKFGQELDEVIRTSGPLKDSGLFSTLLSGRIRQVNFATVLKTVVPIQCLGLLQIPVHVSLSLGSL